MDDETRQAFAELRALINDSHERLLDRMNSLAGDFLTTKTFLIEDALTLGRRMFAVEKRLDDLERRD